MSSVSVAIYELESVLTSLKVAGIAVMTHNTQEEKHKLCGHQLPRPFTSDRTFYRNYKEFSRLNIVTFPFQIQKSKTN